MLQRQFILHPQKLKKEHRFQFDFCFDELNFDVEDGQLHAIHAFPEIESKGVVLYYHGNAGSLDRWGNMSKDFIDRGYEVLMMDYRGFGKSDGRSTEQNMYEDALRMYDFAQSRFSPEDIVVYGRSIGSGVATHVAKHRKSRQLFLETPFYSLIDVVQEKYPFILSVFKLQFEFPNYKNIESLEVPIHVFHGTNDRIVPYSSAKKLEHHLKPGDTFLTVEGGGHKNIPSYTVYQSALDKLL